jgi:phage baseplate assembly protein W
MSAGVPANITSADWSLQVGADPTDGSTLGEVVQGLADVDQAIGIIIMTPWGDDPLRPTFAWDILNIVDLPVTIAIPMIVAGLAEAIEKWEPRATVISITATPINATTELGAHWQITVVWRLNLAAATSAPQTTTRTVPRNS